ncbi:MAG: hypothetical protein ACYDGY_10740 [Acidimicrobiales bacterium]
MTPVPSHRATTKQLSGAYPFLCESGLGGKGALIGQDLLGGPFCYDPFDLYRQGILSNPNMVVLGQLGKGKSSLIKTYLWRQGVFGRRCWVIDPKGEYKTLAAHWGVKPIFLRPGGAVKLNPLDDPRGGRDYRDGAVTIRRVELLTAIVSSSLQRTLLPGEVSAIEMAVRDAESRTRQPIIPHVVEALLSPSFASATALRTTVSDLGSDSRQVALELRRLVSGDMRGMFDGPTSDGISLDAPLVVLDLSAIYASAALGTLMSCAMAWLQGIVERLGAKGDDRGQGPAAGYEGYGFAGGEGPARGQNLAGCQSSAEGRSPGGGQGPARGEGLAGGRVPDRAQVILVVDEAWAVLKNPGVARWLQSSWKLARAKGVSNIAVVHRASDLLAVGAAGAEQIELAKGLLADSETRVVYSQPPGEVALAGELLGLTPVETSIVSCLSKGTALWKVGQRSFLVRHDLSADEHRFVQTDERMGGLGAY